MAKRRVLVIAPHMDDEALGCGGTIARHAAIGDAVTVIFVAHRIYGHAYDRARHMVERSHALKAKKILKYKDAIFLDLADEKLDGSVQSVIIAIEKEVARLKPEIVYIPFRGDNHQDHRAVFDASRVVFRPSVSKRVKNIYMYEIPSSTEQSPPLSENAFIPNRHVDIKRTIEAKLRAYGCYETESRKFPHPRSQDAVKNLARKRGSDVGLEWAEAFMVLKDIWS